jgi:NitT/TauT family transport system ATP-binding protein
MQPRLELRSVDKAYPSEAQGEQLAIHNISFQVGEGEFVCIVGPSGCGKSTILRLLAGFDHPSQGAVLWNGSPIDGPHSDRTVIFQQYALFPWKTVVENVAFGLKAKGINASECQGRSLHWLQRVGLERFAQHYPGQLSGGMQQRVAIARALAVDPTTLLMDEPFGALDALTRESLQDVVLGIWEGNPRSALLVTHSVDEAIILGDRVLVFGGQPGQIRANIVIDLPRPRNKVMRTRDPRFGDYRDTILELLHHKDPSQTDDQPDPNA